jgi:hypothetical protein
MKTKTRKSTYKGIPIVILEQYGVFTAEIGEIIWSLNTFKPSNAKEALIGAKHIIDHPPRWLA